MDTLDIYFISLKESPRRKVCQATTENPPSSEGYSLQFNFHLFDAIDKHSHYFRNDLGYSGLIENSYSSQWLKESEWFNDIHGRELLPEELGCYASHYMLWIKCIESNRPLVILEDDVELKSNFYESLVHCMQSPFDFVRLFATFWEIKTKKSSIAQVGGSQVLPTDPKVEVILKEHFYLSCLEVFAASAYYLTPKAAKAFVSASLHFTEPVDNLLSLVHAHKIPNITYIPISVGFNQYHAISTISGGDSDNLRMSTDKFYRARLITRRLRTLFYQARRYYYYRHFLKRFAHLR
ncbi:glycosyltransferase family 25 protein [Helicobacter cynogastricus]|uniref:glycosyltransferase family 25 protein n=1 Tax=Helicobacter cynogastricus TaxID=329937 RepID=UPI000CF1142E|nr:glycosyltransferase family 25 protein [Helicobacter cynogastricus]